MKWFRNKPAQEKYVQAAITVASNLYLHTIPGAENAPAHLEFGLPDSRYRYFIFCLSAAITAALTYDEKKQVHSSALIEGCITGFAGFTKTPEAQEFLGNSVFPSDVIGSVTSLFRDFFKEWSRWPQLEKEGRNAELDDLICAMIHTTESNAPINDADRQRLGPLALQIDCQLPTMRRAFVELANRDEV